MVDESVLDDPERLARADPDGMLRVLASAGPQVRRTAVSAIEGGVRALADDGLPRSIVVLGTGVAALAGAALAAIAGQQAHAPIVVHRDAWLPRWVGAADMVIGLSPTGAGSTALAAADQAAARGARVVGVGPSESPLAAVVAGARGPYVVIEDARWRRATFWPLLTGLAALAGAVGAVDVTEEMLDRAAVRLDEEAITSRPDSESVLNPAKQLALRLIDAAPAVWAGTEVAAIAARRFTESLAGMAATPAPYSLLDGDPAVFGLFGGGLAEPGDVEDLFRDRVEEPVARRLHPVLLREAEPCPALDRARDLAEYFQLPITELLADEGPALLRLAQLVGQLDLAAAYLAIAIGLDPARETAEGPAPA